MKKPSEKLSNAKSWMMQYFKLVGDKMPDKDQTHLLSWDSRKAIYARYKNDMEIEFQGEAANKIICDQILGKRSKSHISQNQTNTTNG